MPHSKILVRATSYEPKRIVAAGLIPRARGRLTNGTALSIGMDQCRAVNVFDTVGQSGIKTKNNLTQYLGNDKN
jgi:hypothetical protein